MAEPRQVYINTRQLRDRYGGVSHMWVERRMVDELSFPKPVYFGARRFWRIAELEAWERAKAVAGLFGRDVKRSREAGHSAIVCLQPGEQHGTRSTDRQALTGTSSEIAVSEDVSAFRLSVSAGQQSACSSGQPHQKNKGRRAVSSRLHRGTSTAAVGVPKLIGASHD